MFKRSFAISAAAAVLSVLSFSSSIEAKSKIVKAFEPVCDSLDIRIQERIGVKSELKMKSVMKRGNALDFYFDISLSDIPWQRQDLAWFEKELKSLMPAEYRSYNVGRITSSGTPMDELTVGALSFDGEPDKVDYQIKKIPKASQPLVDRKDGFNFEKGLENKHIALWQSHGLYFDNATGRWRWQRPRLFGTAEDLFTQSFVLPYLVPMLENAGAYVMIPRERDFNKNEIIIDNDPSFDREKDTTLIFNVSGPLRTNGIYSESGPWANSGTGFADAKAIYTETDNPFTMGTARSADCIEKETNKTVASRAVWTPVITEAGEYAVYISYRSLPESTESAHYTVNHAGGKTEFIVNQKMGGGTWIYLGTFMFEAGDKGYVELDNLTPKGRKFVKGSKVSADAVKIGGGMGNIARNSASELDPETSGFPRFAESARYWLQWAGADTTVYRQNGGSNDYRDDLMSRGDWITHLSGGSDVNPGAEGRGIPFDLTFAMHSDAGTMPNDSTIGTLMIYSLESERNKKLPSGESRRTSRDYANLVQSQIVNDVRAQFDSSWNKRWLWNRGYRESRTPSTPTVLCELLSHQNFADMRLGHDPAFKFCASRAIYKGMLKYLSNRYGTEYVVQPLPVSAFSAALRGDKVILEWSATPDAIEPTAVAEGFLIQTRVNGGGFDSGIRVKAEDVAVVGSDRFRTMVPISPGHIYSFRISAWNAGGLSFPSEILSAGIPEEPAVGESSAADSCVLIVNNFDRVSAPAWFDFPDYAGFDTKLDSGVPYMSESSFVGEMYRFHRAEPWASDDNPGFGASYNDRAGNLIAGNTFDYPYTHGKAILECGYPFCSASASAFAADSTLRKGKWCVDLICGKQVRTLSGGLSSSGTMQKEPKYAVFPEALRKTLTSYTAEGGNVIITGANIGTDVWSNIYPIERDSTLRQEEIGFAEKVLGYRWQTSQACNNGRVRVAHISSGFITGGLKTLTYNHLYDEKMYRVENPDGIGPSDKSGNVILRYGDTGIAAGIARYTGTYGTVCIGFPLESIREYDALKTIFESSFKFFVKNGRETEGNN